MYEKTDKEGYVRDTQSGSIVNNDLDALKAYKLKKQQSKMILDNDKRISQIENDITEIKNMIRKYLSLNN